MQSALSEKFIDFLSQAVSPYHSVEQCRKILDISGFEHVKDSRFHATQFKKGGKYYVTKNHSAIVAFAIGEQLTQSSGVVVAAGHTDSPVLRIRPNHIQHNHGYLQLGCELYGGGLWHTWLDRELGAAGKIVVKRDGGVLEEVLVNLDRAICFIPNLCIHLQSAEERAAFTINKEKHLRPVVERQLCGGKIGEVSPILCAIQESYGIDPSNIVDLDMSLYDINPPKRAGHKSEFILGGRMDNQVSTFAIMEALAQVNVKELKDIVFGVAFDHEECGSMSYVGANSDMFSAYCKEVVKAVFVSSFTPFSDVMQRSLLLSVDGAHGLHPNYAEKHQAEHQATLGKGMVIKTNSNQRYTSNALTRALVKSICEANNVQLQDFCVPNTSPCGSTIGPFMSSRMGIRALDCGVAQLAMHSIRETIYSDDLDTCYNMIVSVFSQFREFDSKLVSLDDSKL